MNNYLLSFITFSKPVIAGVIFLFACLVYNPITFQRLSFLHEYGKKSLYRYLFYGMTGFYVLYATALTVLQYLAWSNTKFTNLLLHMPITNMFKGGTISWLFNNKLGYFLFYSWGSFWLEIFLIGIMSVLFWLFLHVLRRYNDRFFVDGEVELGALMILLIGWPADIIFIGMVFFSVVIVSIARLIIFKEAYTTLGYPFLLAAFVTLIWGNALISLFSLGVLQMIRS
ncbi:MAG: hypothetical protein V1652_02950 [bacterium]